MCRPIRAITQAKGFDTSSHVLAVFGGAGGQHACAIARNLGIKKIYVHRLAGILSAFGISLADEVYEVQEPYARILLDTSSCYEELKMKTDAMAKSARNEMILRGFSSDHIKTKVFVNLRYVGTDTAIMILVDSFSKHISSSFVSRYQREYGFTLDRELLIDDVRIRCIGKSSTSTQHKFANTDVTTPLGKVKVYFVDAGWLEIPLFSMERIAPESSIHGPALIIDSTSTILLDPLSTGKIDLYGHLTIHLEKKQSGEMSYEVCDPVLLSIFSHRFMSIAEQMGRTLQRTSISTNIKERLDFSCAIFGPDGGLVANAPHLPVHLGSMQEAVKFQMQFLGPRWHRDEVILSNHPQAGGSHLPDITVITPVNEEGSGQRLFYLASRGHHADVGGISPGSMPPFSKLLKDEGAAIMSFKLVTNGQFDEAGITKILVTAGSRCLSDNLSDLKAQVAANEKGRQLVGDLIKEYGIDVVQAYMKFIQQNAEESVRSMLKELVRRSGKSELIAEDFMDDGTPIRLKVSIDPGSGSAVFDFTGTGSQVYGNCNSPKAVTYSAIIYCLRCMVKEDIPLNQGCLQPITTIVPESSILNPSPEMAVVGGNVLTSQRVTDVILKAFEACAASQGCMNNLTFGDSTFGYYETIAGGAGAGPSWHGQSGVHTHMTNTRITDPEILERRYPVQLNRFHLRDHSGGQGEYNGGDGVVREIEFLKPLSVGILSERRAFEPFGLHGGSNGARGMNMVLRRDGSVVGLGGKNAYEADSGDRILLLTPGGGGFGVPKKSGVRQRGKSSPVRPRPSTGLSDDEDEEEEDVAASVVSMVAVIDEETSPLGRPTSGMYTASSLNVETSYSVSNASVSGTSVDSRPSLKQKPPKRRKV
eukprot:TRINITY_DN21915_c1_g1_i1.p1 TRINITY_DN21915_c1_g1~~TRINITY_DN21915_c1_g1_i1.p1  ORF type:complete len:928 (-),score=223.32 TRINITY_DN21915_c1_g1_i1:60-2681(-)